MSILKIKNMETFKLNLKHKVQCLPYQQFQVLFTLFSKFFSSFPHGTCLLSVSDQYLAFDGFYHHSFLFFYK